MVEIAEILLQLDELTAEKKELELKNKKQFESITEYQKKINFQDKLLCAATKDREFLVGIINTLKNVVDENL